MSTAEHKGQLLTTAEIARLPDHANYESAQYCLLKDRTEMDIFVLVVQRLLASQPNGPQIPIVHFMDSGPKFAEMDKRAYRDANDTNELASADDAMLDALLEDAQKE